MKTFALLSAFAATALAQAVSQGIAPTATAPAGCEPTYTGSFTLDVVKMSGSSKREEKRSDALVCTLHDGILTDSLGRTGSIVANHQFQFDGPPQAGAIYTGGFSVCSNGSLALGGSAVWYQCLSGSFYNLYDENVAAQCTPILIVAEQYSTATTTNSPVAEATVSSSTSETQQSSTSATTTPSPSQSEIKTLTSSTSATGVTGFGYNSTLTAFAAATGTGTGIVIATGSPSLIGTKVLTSSLAVAAANATGSAAADSMKASAAAPNNIPVGAAALALLGFAGLFL